MRVLLTCALALALNCLYAQKPAVVTDNDLGWKKVGEITASFKMQDESIVVFGKDEFSAVRLKVSGAPIHIERMQIFFEEGGVQEAEVGENLKAGAQTKSISLNGNKELNKVAFTYKTVANNTGNKAKVELWGLKTQKD